MSQYSTGHDHAVPAPDAKYENRMRYARRAQSPASPRLDSRSLPPGVLPPGSLPPGELPPGSQPPGVVPHGVVPHGVVPHGPVPDQLTKPARPPPGDKPINDDFMAESRFAEEYRKAMNRPQVPSTVVNEPYVNHDEKMQYPKPAPPTAIPRPDNLWGTCKKPGGCNKHVEDKSPPAPTTMNPVNPSVRPSLGNNAKKTSSEPWLTKWEWCAVCIPCMAIGCILLCTACSVGKRTIKNKYGDEEEPEEEEEEEE